MEGEKCSETFFEALERQNMQNKIIFELYADDNKSLYPSNPKDILKSEKKKKKKKLYTKQTSTAANTNFLAKLITERKYLINTLDLWKAEVSVDEIIKS